MSDLIKILNNDDFDSTIANGTVMVDFFAEWCGPCKMMAPVLEEVAEELGDQVVIAKIDIDESIEVAAKFQITAVPTLILFKDGKETQRIVGVKDKEQLKELVLQ